MRTEYKIQNYNARKLFVTFLSSFLLIIILLILISVLIDMPSLAAGGFACLCILPFLIQNKIKALFVQKMSLIFDDVFFSITPYSAYTGLEKKTKIIPWSEIKSYNVYFSPSKNTIITFYLRNGKYERWNFSDNRTIEDALKWESLFKLFFSYIKQYNKDKVGDAKIGLNQGFLNSSIGTIVINSEIALVVIGFIVHLLLHPPSSILTLLMGGSLAFQLYIKRKQEKETFNRISALE
jgi:hypothetical protein